MESGLQDDSKTLSEESDDERSGRTYECVFCKRGFTTAQALGGHMNIHRRDRARNKQPIVPTIVNQPTRSGLLQPNSNQSQLYSSNMETNMSYQIYLPPSTSSTLHPHGYHIDDLNTQKRQPLSLFEDDQRSSLSLQIGPTHIEDKEDNKEDEEDDELDLELRLGHDP